MKKFKINMYYWLVLVLLGVDQVACGCAVAPKDGQVNWPESKEHIPDNAFMDCKELISINIPSSVSSIGRSAFTGSNLKHLEINSARLVG